MLYAWASCMQGSALRTNALASVDETEDELPLRPPLDPVKAALRAKQLAQEQAYYRQRQVRALHHAHDHHVQPGAS